MMPVDQRRLAHARRGLASYPEDLPGDAERLDMVAALLGRLSGPLRMRLPAFGLELEVPPEVGARTVYLLAMDDYETADLDLLVRHVGRGDRLMVVGGGIGIAAALGARLTGEPVTVVEANEALHRVIAAQVRLAGGRAEIVGAAAVADAADHPDGTAAFAVADEFWYSRLGDGEGNRPVPARAFASLCAEHRPTAVLLDIEGAEAAILAAGVPEEVRTVIVEIHTPDLGAAATGEVITGMVRQSFRVADQQALTWVFRR